MQNLTNEDLGARMTQKALKAMESKEGREILLVAPYAWGRAPDGADAFRILKKNMSSYAGKEPPALVYDVPTGAWVDGMGTIRWEDGSQEIFLVGHVTFRNPRFP